jgi:hypothetical protein
MRMPMIHNMTLKGGGALSTSLLSYQPRPLLIPILLCQGEEG